MDLLMRLEVDAAAEGARVHVLLGNHEAMNLLGETRDVTYEIFATFADGESENRREDKGGRPSALEIAGDRITALYEEGATPLVGSQSPVPEPVR